MRLSAPLAGLHPAVTGGGVFASPTSAGRHKGPGSQGGGPERGRRLRCLPAICRVGTRRPERVSGLPRAGSANPLAGLRAPACRWGPQAAGPGAARAASIACYSGRARPEQSGQKTREEPPARPRAAGLPESPDGRARAPRPTARPPGPAMPRAPRWPGPGGRSGAERGRGAWGRGPGAGRAETAGRSPVWLVPRSPALGAKMTASKRVAKELEELQRQLPQYLRNLRSEEDDVLVWRALLLPERPPYNLKAFSVCISFPREYPFQPPTVKFTTRIYHPNVDRDGRVCLPIISKKNWKASTRICQVLEALNVLVNQPEPGEPVRLELAEQLIQDPELFDRTAQEFTLQFGVDRPC
ncbi:ubiquitin/ISG15-conjugating enzyme E2 L6 isoform X2 [Muntiacus reevesi]|uniref:ubiquitin/ISG15-conjugating enzyme E2 L6 isoform X2 n=1 Tax=Muntiacus reevesi TaxID=9886 RepID=UPI0033072317